MGTRVFIGGLRDPRMRERDLEDFFKGFGRVREVVLKNGYGFVEFEDLRDAEDAVCEKNGKSLNGDRVVVEHAKRPGADRGRSSFGSSRYSPPRARAPIRSNYRVIVENVSSRVTWKDLKDFMRKSGEVNYCDTHRPNVGEGVAEYATREGMERALDELDGKELSGKRIKVREDKGRSRSRSPRRRRSRSRSRKRSASRSKSRSKSKSRSRSRPPVKKNRSRSRSRSPAVKKGRSRSRSPAVKKGRSRSRSPAVKKGRSRSRSPAVKKGRSRSRSPATKKSRSKSRSPATKKSRSRSRSKERNGRIHD